MRVVGLQCNLRAVRQYLGSLHLHLGCRVHDSFCMERCNGPNRRLRLIFRHGLILLLLLSHHHYPEPQVADCNTLQRLSFVDRLTCLRTQSWLGCCVYHFSCLAVACRSEEHTSELQSRPHLVCRLLLEKKKLKKKI